MKNPTLKEPTIPYVDTHIVGEHNGLNNGNITIISFFKVQRFFFGFK